MNSLVIEEGDFLVLAGSSGSGKTTLLRHFKKNYGQLVHELEPYFIKMKTIKSCRIFGQQPKSVWFFKIQKTKL